MGFLSWLRPKKIESDEGKTNPFILASRLPNAEMIEVLHQSVMRSSPEDSAHVIIAYENLEAMWQTFKDMTSKHRCKTVLDFVRLPMHDRRYFEFDEAQKYRAGWFFFAGMLMYLSGQSEKSEHLRGKLAEMWIKLCKDADALPRALNRALWSDEEKTWFSDIPEDFGYKRYVLEIVVPPHIRQMSLVEQYYFDLSYEQFEAERNKPK